jgi:putative redox protein
MIRATSEEPRYLNKFSNGKGAGFADVSEEQGGTGISFRPHDLLEAALATCINITLRMYAERHGLPLEDVSTVVSLDHGSSGTETIFRYEVELRGGNLTNEQRAKLLEIARSCSVRRSLSRPIRFDGAAHESATPVAVRQAATAIR